MHQSAERRIISHYPDLLLHSHFISGKSAFSRSCVPETSGLGGRVPRPGSTNLATGGTRSTSFSDRTPFISYDPPHNHVRCLVLWPKVTSLCLERGGSETKYLHDYDGTSGVATDGPTFTSTLPHPIRRIRGRTLVILCQLGPPVPCFYVIASDLLLSINIVSVLQLTAFIYDSTIDISKCNLDRRGNTASPIHPATTLGQRTSSTRHRDAIVWQKYYP